MTIKNVQQLVIDYCEKTNNLELIVRDNGLSVLLYDNLEPFINTEITKARKQVIVFIIANIIHLFRRYKAGVGFSHLIPATSDNMSLIHRSVVPQGLYECKHLKDEIRDTGIFSSTAHAAWDNIRWAIVFSI